ncbi:MAG: glycosyltransferase [Candidatus Dojkabacteria bacterium]|nr:MAG: glycosyltransferase [Candidatus Dojkabacteria bacterium]
MKLSIIIPAKDEAHRIRPTILDVYYSLTSRFNEEDFEVLVIVNNTTDETVDILQQVKKDNRFKSLQIIDIGKVNGKGEAVLQGVSMSQGDIIGFIDADGASPGQDIVSLYRVLHRDVEYDAIISSRYMRKSKIIGHLPLTRHIMSRLFNIAVRTLFRLYFNDTQCGLKLFRAPVIKQVAPYIVAKGWTFDVNILLIMKYLGYKTKEHASTWYVKNGSKLNVAKAIPNVIKEFIQMYRQVIKYRIFSKLEHA